MKQPKSIVLHQCQVTDKHGKHILVGPAMDRKPVIEQFASEINKAVAEGKERDWRDAQVVDIHPIQH